MPDKSLAKSLDRKPSSIELEILKRKFVDYCITKSLYPVNLPITHVEVFDLIQMVAAECPRWQGLKSIEELS